MLNDIIERDGAVCIWCGREPWRADLTAELVLPRSRGGRGTPENIAVACRSCNKRRRTSAVTAFVRAQLATGRAPRRDLIAAALERLAASSAPQHASYGARQLALLERVAPPAGPAAA